MKPEKLNLKFAKKLIRLTSIMVVSLSCTSSDLKCFMAVCHIKLNELFLNN